MENIESDIKGETFYFIEIELVSPKLLMFLESYNNGKILLLWSTVYINQI